MIYKYKTTMQSKKFDSSKSKVKFKLTIYSNEYGVIYNWQIKLLDMHFCTGSQPEYFKNKNLIWKFREKICNLLNVAHVESSKNGKIINLSVENLEKIDNLLNDREIFKSTLKTIDAITRGNNWTGSFSNPSNSNLISVDFAPGSILLIDKLISFDPINIVLLDINSEKRSFNELFKLTPDLNKMYKYINEEKNAYDYSMFINTMNSYVNKYVKTTSQIQKIINNERAKYGKKVEKHYSSWPFGFRSVKEFQKAHIYDVHLIKSQIIKLHFSEKKYDNYIKMISDPENFIPLPESIHREFDRNSFTYTKEGFIQPISKEGKEFIDNFVEKKLKQIPKTFLTYKRQKYIDMRNQKIV